MNRRQYLLAVGTAAVAVAGGYAYTSRNNAATASPPPDIDQRIDADGFQIREDGGEWEDLLVRGVNLGESKPGAFPREGAITKDEYARWLEQIAEMNSNVVRTYTLHPPGFYEALAEHNSKVEDPIFLLQGNWIGEAILTDRRDVFDADVAESYRDGIQIAVDAVHGDGEVSDGDGRIGGTYDADVSPYVLGYIMGAEWPPRVVEETDEQNEGIGEYQGTYVETDGATPFEYWLAEQLDETIAYENDQYDDSRPVSFTNWPTLDHLEHPEEPDPLEDLVSVTANHHHATDDYDSGLFATYHVYPYYPDFLNYEVEHDEHGSDEGRTGYREYLEELVDANDYPVLVGEYGVPSSRGMTYRHVGEFDQGRQTEQEQGELDARLYEDIVEAGTMGGSLFSWQDEWYKRSWNTRRLTNRERRPFWSDVQTSGQSFGMLGFDPVDPPGRFSFIFGDPPVITLSGRPDEWEDATELHSSSPSPIASLDSDHDGQQTLTGLQAAADARYLYLRLDYDDLGTDVDWERTNTLVLLNVKPDQGITSVPFETDLSTSDGVDFLVHLAGPDDSRVLVDSYYDTFYYQYGEELDMIPERDYADEVDNGRFHRSRLALSKERSVPDQDEGIEFDYYETGRLRYGIGDPDASEYDSLTDVAVTPEANLVEIRLPWLLVNVRDPSQREVIADLWEDGLSESVSIDGISASAVTFDPTGESTAESQPNITDSIPDLDDGRLPIGDGTRFSWETWDEPTYNERLKPSYDIMTECYDRYA
ncbi:hypothetical protein [Natronoglomus mannanivorans]|uniref:Uncharacterized protein n=1 Tax=Natronoglomus mannanivorans TaxID=2979990 RepID=A0AAP3E375_9EURY|nr:hypothetical protein [Halobacteria archaeon AArc-xg1-1]